MLYKKLQRIQTYQLLQLLEQETFIQVEMILEYSWENFQRTPQLKQMLKKV